MHVYYFFLPVMNVGASETIARVSVMILEVATHHQGPPIDPWHSSAS